MCYLCTDDDTNLTNAANEVATDSIVAYTVMTFMLNRMMEQSSNDPTLVEALKKKISDYQGYISSGIKMANPMSLMAAINAMEAALEVIVKPEHYKI